MITCRMFHIEMEHATRNHGLVCEGDAYDQCVGVGQGVHFQDSRSQCAQRD